MRWRVGLTILILLQISGLSGCRDCRDEVEAVKAYLDDPAHLACATDADCETVYTGCHTFERGLCGQAGLSKSAAGSKQWSELSADLDGCGDSTCAQCLALLVVPCRDGFCGGKP